METIQSARVARVTSTLAWTIATAVDVAWHAGPAVEPGALSVISAAKPAQVAASHSRPTGSNLTDESTLPSVGATPLVP